jgi:hypothetical protein
MWAPFDCCVARSALVLRVTVRKPSCGEKKNKGEAKEETTEEVEPVVLLLIEAVGEAGRYEACAQA